MTFRFLLLAFLCSAASTSTAFAQFRVPETQLTYVAEQLKEAQQELNKKVGAINYLDPGAGDEDNWRVSQAAWEKMESRIGYPSAMIKKMIAIDPAKRSEWQTSSLKSFYLGFVHAESKRELQPLAERVEWLQSHKRAGKKGVTDEAWQTIVKRFWKRRFVDTYRETTKDKPETQKLVIAFLNQAAINFADNGRLDNLADGLCRKCLKTGSKHPVYKTLSYHLHSHEQQKRWPEGRKELPKIISQLKSPEYPPVIEMLARMAQCEIFRAKNNKNGKELDEARADQLSAEFNKTIITMLAAESRCPENIEALRFMIRKFSDGFRKARHRIALYESVEESGLHEGFKQATLQKTGSQLAYSRHLENALRKDYIVKAMKHGEAATELLPLSTITAEQLIGDTYSRSKPEVCARWFEVGTQRAPGRYSLYRSYFGALFQISDADEQSEFILKLLKSEEYSAGVPIIGVRLMNEHSSRHSEGPRHNKQVILAIEELLKKAPDNGASPEWVLKQKRFLNHIMMQAKMFEDALRVAKDLDDDSGLLDYKGQKLTIAKIAELCNPLANEVQESINAGTFDIATASQTIEKLREARMDMGTDEGTYIDELLDLIRCIEDFESGKWAQLTQENVYLTNWKADTYPERWKPISNGIEMSFNNDSVVDHMAWRWSVQSEYVLEADIESVPLKKFKAKWGANAGFLISGYDEDRYKMVAGRGIQVLLNPHLGTASIHTFREKEFSVKDMLNKKGPNRLRLRVWKDYFEFTINGKMAGQFAIPAANPGYVMLYKSHGAANTIFTNVRVRKLNSPSPTGERIGDAFYWKKRLKIEPLCKDIQQSLAKAKQDDESDKGKAGEANDVQNQDQDRKPLIVKDGLIAMWTFDKDLSESFSGQEAVAAMSHKIVDGQVGRGLLLAQANNSNRIVADGDGPIKLDQPFTIAFWVRRQSENGVLISQSGKRAGLVVNITDEDLQVLLGLHGLRMANHNKQNLPLKTWQHIAVTYDGSNDSNGLVAYLQGKERTGGYHSGRVPATQVRPPVDSSQTKLRFGSNPFGTHLRYGGQAVIDEVRIYDRKLSPEEVMQVMSYKLK